MVVLWIEDAVVGVFYESLRIDWQIEKYETEGS